MGSPGAESDTRTKKETDLAGAALIYARIGEHVLTIKLVDNSSVTAFAALLGQGNVEVAMHDYGGAKKWTVWVWVSAAQ